MILLYRLRAGLFAKSSEALEVGRLPLEVHTVEVPGLLRRLPVDQCGEGSRGDFECQNVVHSRFQLLPFFEERFVTGIKPLSA